MPLSERTYSTPLGTIRYWVNGFVSERPCLVFLPGLTADHTLFDKQVEAFAEEYNILVWDAPAHGQSRPFPLAFSLRQIAQWLHAIVAENCDKGAPLFLVGQSMGGYVAQEYMYLYPKEVAGAIIIDSAPVERTYITRAELWLLKHIGPVYRLYPWTQLQRTAAQGCSTTEYGRTLMYSMLSAYTHGEYCALAAHGYRILAEAIEQHTAPVGDCPILLLVGEHDRAGSCLRYCRNWSERQRLPLVYVPAAGHNSNTDNPAFVNRHIREFVEKTITTKHINH